MNSTLRFVLHCSGSQSEYLDALRHWQSLQQIHHDGDGEAPASPTCFALAGVYRLRRGYACKCQQARFEVTSAAWSGHHQATALHNPKENGGLRHRKS